jgi:hypothetical protein
MRGCSFIRLLLKAVGWTIVSYIIIGGYKEDNIDSRSAGNSYAVAGCTVL